MPVYQNPSMRQITREIKKSGYLRVVRDKMSGDVYAWPGGEGLHEEVIRRLGLSDMTENLGQAFSAEDFARILATDG